MIEAHEFIDRAQKFGYYSYAGVPCSFLTPFINHVIARDDINYISATNEGDAVAIASGAYLAGQPAVAMMQNSGLGNAINPLTSLNHTFCIPILLIVTLRGDPDLKDEPQHELMGRITGSLLESMKIPWEYFPQEIPQIQPTLERATYYIKEQRRPYALVVCKDSIAPYGASGGGIPHRILNKAAPINFPLAAPVHSRNEILSHLHTQMPKENSVVIATTGYTGRELFALEDRENQLYMVGSMGCASSLGLGISLTRPDLQVIVIDGDGAALMRMGNFATVGTYGQPNFTHILLDNEVHDSTGSQATISGNFSFANIASSCGYEIALSGNEVTLLDQLFAHKTTKGPKFAQIKIHSGTVDHLPRPKLSPEETTRRLMTYISKCK
ncbi:phosphonopyruvate decarboxylase [Candidatus Nitrosacidococcus tergens]|uniref:Phosphonopyruvate decarboxylase n=1 Tax=Candidatus Nitrosacidococcus tergens TaxID=553981 RepID=A0A7G1Q8K8_9GAMM|nr:phosphonopyruvate decarboxylase [Candidatus Nitrosacidococcus tergens]CAB1275219.1 Phosphonopyruvate decarboxylase [Candidatus Nitrosacidococcus tergens]